MSFLVSFWHVFDSEGLVLSNGREKVYCLFLPNSLFPCKFKEEGRTFQKYVSPMLFSYVRDAGKKKFDYGPLKTTTLYLKTHDIYVDPTDAPYGTVSF